MAASSVIPARTGAPADRGLIARTAARTAPRGPGLAPVVALPLGTPATPAAALAPVPARRAEGSVATDGRPVLRLVESPRRGGVGRARPLLLLTAAVTLLAVLVGPARSMLIDPEMPVAAGHVVLEPGETLWDVAVRSAPNGVDPREQLDALRRLNGFGSAGLDAWTVVLIPAP